MYYVNKSMSFFDPYFAFEILFINKLSTFLPHLNKKCYCNKMLLAPGTICTKQKITISIFTI